MKVSILLLLLTTISFVGFTQSEKSITPKSKLESVLNSKGEIIFKEYEELFELKPSFSEFIQFKKLKVVSIKSNIKTFGLYINGNEFRPNGLSRDGYTFIDQNEIVGLIEFLTFVLDKTKNIESKQTEYIFSTNDFDVSLYNSKFDPRKTFPKEEPSYNYWLLTFKVGQISPFRFTVKNIEDIQPLIEKLKGLTFE